MGLPEIPDILKDANWQKEKGKFAKVFGGETGIGAQMNKLKAAYGKLDLAKTNVAMAYKNLEEVDKAIATCKAELRKTDDVRKEAYALRDLARKVAADFKKNKLIPGATSLHLENVAKVADAFGVSVKSYDPTKDFEAAKKRIETTLELQRKILRDGMAKCVSAVNGVKGGKATPEDWDKKAWQAIRAYSASVAKSPELKAVHAEWKVLASIGKEKLKDAAAVAKHVAAMDALLKKTAPLID